MIDAANENGASGQDLNILLRRIATEVDCLCQGSRRFDQSLGNLIALLDDSAAGVHIGELQFQDYLVQSLGCLAQVLNAAATEVSSGQTIDISEILNELPLKDISARLGASGDRCPTLQEENPVHLF